MKGESKDSDGDGRRLPRPVYATSGSLLLTREWTDKYRQHWQIAYQFADLVRPLLPKGTVLLMTSVFDNTEANPDDPDPNQVGDRRRSRDVSRLDRHYVPDSGGVRKAQGRARQPHVTV